MSLVPTELSLAIGSTTDAAGRPRNEDAVIARPIPAPASNPGDSFLLAVADGMGGHAGGDIASKRAIALLEELLSRDTPEDVALSLKQAYRRANEVIYAEGSDESDAQRMGTTLVSAVVRGKYATIANVGDSRAYLVRASQVTQITQDHSVVGERVAKGELTEEQARKSPQRNLVTHALGLTPTLDRRMPSIYELTLLPEDRLLLCSDGFFDVLQPDDYVSTLRGREAQDSAVALASMAIERGTTDNVSAVVLAVGQSMATAQREQIGQQIAAQPKTNPLMIQVGVLVMIVLIAVIFAGFYFLL